MKSVSGNEKEEKMKYFSDYYSCPFCGAALDPGESCDCQEATESKDRKTKEENHADDNETAQPPIYRPDCFARAGLRSCSCHSA